MSLAGQGGDGVYIYFGAVAGDHGEGVFWGAGQGHWEAAVGGSIFRWGCQLLPGVHAGGGAGRWALGYYLWGFRTSLIFANFLSIKSFRS